jgi:hypothetical protein
MAVGVANAACVIAFMDSRYQVSENCQLELKYSKQMSVPIIPVIMEESWKAGGWLGICTAGLLWTPLYDDTMFANHIGSVCDRVSKYFRPGGAVAAASPVKAEREVKAVREDLDRLKENLRDEDTDQDNGSAETGLATLPAEVPLLPVAFRRNPEMVELKAKVLDPQSGSRIGFFGMGGAGETSTSPPRSCSDIARRTSHISHRRENRDVDLDRALGACTAVFRTHIVV